jgi:ammonia channel protein AmtB
VAGLVSSSSTSSLVSYTSSFVIGLIGAIIFQLGVQLQERISLDDPVNSWAICGLCGAWSIVAVGIFDLEKGLLNAGKITQVGL